MSPTVVARGDGDYLKVSIEHGEYNALEEWGGPRTLLMAESNFIIAIRETLRFWPPTDFPKAFRPLVEIMDAVTFSEEEEHTPFAPVVPIPLDGRTIVQHRWNGLLVYVPVETFVRGAVSYLAEQPVLKLKGWHYGFRRALQEAWSATRELVDERQPVSQGF